MVSRQCILAKELEDIEREKFDRLLAKRQLCQYFPPSIYCAIQYFITQMPRTMAKQRPQGYKFHSFLCFLKFNFLDHKLTCSCTICSCCTIKNCENVVAAT